MECQDMDLGHLSGKMYRAAWQELRVSKSISALTIKVAMSRQTKIKNWKKGIYCLSLSGRGGVKQFPVPAAEEGQQQVSS